MIQLFNAVLECIINGWLRRKEILQLFGTGKKEVQFCFRDVFCPVLTPAEENNNVTEKA